MAKDRMNNPELNEHSGMKTGNPGNQGEQGHRGQQAPSRNTDDEQRGSQRGTSGPDAERKNQGGGGSINKSGQGESNRGNR